MYCWSIDNLRTSQRAGDWVYAKSHVKDNFTLEKGWPTLSVKSLRLGRLPYPMMRSLLMGQSTRTRPLYILVYCRAQIVLAVLLPCSTKQLVNSLFIMASKMKFVFFAIFSYIASWLFWLAQYECCYYVQGPV